MKYVIVAGGTAGHINPALALGEKLRDLGHEVIFAGTPNRLESRLVPEAGFKFKSFEAYGFNRKKPATLVRALNSMRTATKSARVWLAKIQPKAVIGFGCYVSLPVCRAAFNLDIPVVIHEQNSVMGMANKYLSGKATCVCLTYKRADSGRAQRVELTGNPVRKSVLEAGGEAGKLAGRKMLGVSPDSKLLVVFGGSLGAEHINSAIVDMLPSLLVVPDLEIVHITGDKDFDNVADHVEEVEAKTASDPSKEGVLDTKRYHLLSYQNEMGKTLAAADFIVSRAGASSLAEITALCVPALLVPYPLATENHQFYNAQDLVKNGAAMIIDDSAVSTEEFKKAVMRLITDSGLTADMRDALSKLDTASAVDKLADIVINL